MAKRRKLEAPSIEDIARLEAEFRRETPSRNPMGAPIAQVAAEVAQGLDPRSALDRTAAAQDKADADRYRLAQSGGLLLSDIPLEAIDADALVRDRIALDPEELAELQLSISAQGLRLPIEVFEMANGRFGLLSGYRRLRAVQNLRGLTGQGKYGHIRAIIRDPEAMGGTFAAMVEENEVRANLSHFERGRIAVIAAQQGAFTSVEAAVDALFSVASKAKRSKIRSFALIFEELGDMLSFPEALREKDGLRLAAALRDGHEATLRDRLADVSPATAADEAEALIATLDTLHRTERPTRGGRPRTQSANTQKLQIDVVQTQDGWTLQVLGADRDTAEKMKAHLTKHF